MAKIWHPKNTVSLDRINKLNQNTVIGYLDIKITHIGDDFIQGTMPVNQKTIQPQG
ncbi:esterase, partial [Marine Group I thaumarchaeote]|nr:esterase [Marine Group I thaumarchaeote]